ncbi:DUF1871 family protein [Clostridium oceanicum]|uniref:DUF1871 family protein n=1 Tax=Clostridium oceanicum TaxID=1543 RepID=A0ABP3USI8_9CLOT
MIKVQKIINDWDPIGLMKHAPDDEYESEIIQIIHKLLDTDTVEELAKIIRDIFVQAFGEDMFCKTIEECMVVARNIMK